MRKIGVFYNFRQTQEEIARHIADMIAERGGEVVLFSEVKEIEGVDRLIVLGGDGTVLRAAKRAAELRIPLVGVNYGNLGFLTEFERGEEEQAVSFVFGDCPIQKRSMLEVGLDGEKFYCLNELSLLHAVTKGSKSKVTKISVAIDGSKAGDFSADGLIVATPTGSTAYSLSAGGSVMTPDSPTFLLTPVCAFSLRSRPIAYPDQCSLTFCLTEEPLLLYGDGDYLGEADSSHQLTVRRAEREACFLTRDPKNYFRRLTEKINH